MGLLVVSTYQQYHIPIVFGQQSFLLSLTPNNKSILLIYLEDYLRNMVTYLANILVCSRIRYTSMHYRMTYLLPKMTPIN
jgi:hypothetical protein